MLNNYQLFLFSNVNVFINQDRYADMYNDLSKEYVNIK